ncbi:MAG: hypothetical protein WCW63_00065 [Acholeplasmataceae bacterium]
MKKTILTSALLLCLSVAALAGCDSKVEPIDEGELINSLAATALSEVGVSYATFSTDGIAVGDIDLVTSINEKVSEEDEIGVNFNIDYTVTAQEAYNGNYLTYADGVLTAVLLTPDGITGCTLAESLGGAVYTLAATISFAGYGDGFIAPKGLTVTDSLVGQDVGSKSWNCLVIAADAVTGTFSEIKSTAVSGDYAYFTGRVSGWYQFGPDESYRGIFLSDGSDGIMLYAGSISTAFFSDSEVLINKGDVISVYGLVSPYSGLFEVKPNSITKITDPTTIASIAPLSYQTVGVTDITSGTTVLTGNFVSVPGLTLKTVPTLTVGSHWTVVAQDASGNELTIYVNYHVGETAQNAIKTIFESLGSTGTFTFQGVVSAYNSLQVTPIATATTTADQCFIAD